MRISLETLMALAKENAPGAKAAIRSYTRMAISKGASKHRIETWVFDEQYYTTLEKR